MWSQSIFSTLMFLSVETAVTGNLFRALMNRQKGPHSPQIDNPVRNTSFFLQKKWIEPTLLKAVALTKLHPRKCSAHFTIQKKF